MARGVFFIKRLPKGGSGGSVVNREVGDVLEAPAGVENCKKSGTNGNFSIHLDS